MFYSFDGLKAAYQNESAFRQELFLVVVLMGITVLLPITLTQMALLFVVNVSILIVELLNSAIEATVDRISVEEHALAKRAKDVASAAVLVTLVLCACVWGLVLADAFL
ncbi:MAG: diacylglycerol kinase [Gammaproteobacteria bacterium]|nr:diacylglycerol kinase [Gammaproteobacteria bacterium]